MNLINNAMATNMFPVIKTEKLLMRQFADDDLVYVYTGLSNPEIIKYYGVSYQTMEETIVQMNYFSELEKLGTGIWWAVCSKNNKDFYGAIGLSNINKEHKKAEIGFWLLKDYWGKGIMSEAISVVCNYSFNYLRLHRIEALVETGNSNCIKIMEKHNFNFEGTMVDCEFKNGGFISLNFYARLNN